MELKELLEAEGILLEVPEGNRETIRENTMDYLGVNYYHLGRTKARTTVYEGLLMPEKYYEPYEFEGQKMNTSRGWEIYEPAIYDIAMNLKENYGNTPWYISEDGMGIRDEEQFMGADGMVEDDYRIEFIKEHLTYLHRAIEGGCDCFGYRLWLQFDCWSWTNAYKNRYGLSWVGIYDGCKITTKKSAHWFRKLSESNGF